MIISLIGYFLSNTFLPKKSKFSHIGPRATCCIFEKIDSVAFMTENPTFFLQPHHANRKPKMRNMLNQNFYNWTEEV